MSEDGGESIPRHHEPSHYHGDSVRIIFFASALLLILGASTSISMPVSGAGAVLAAIILVIAAGLTNPKVHSIHWSNGLLALWGTFVFGTEAVTNYRETAEFFNTAFLITEALAVLFLVALYLTTRTIRGLIQKRPHARLY